MIVYFAPHCTDLSSLIRTITHTHTRIPGDYFNREKKEPANAAKEEPIYRRNSVAVTRVEQRGGSQYGQSSLPDGKQMEKEKNGREEDCILHTF
jgi:hypothetical protein